jgi:hypothetical protein
MFFLVAIAYPCDADMKLLYVFVPQAFLYAVVRTEALKQNERCRQLDSHRPVVLPAAICEPLCTTDQQNWWNSVYKLTTSAARYKSSPHSIDVFCALIVYLCIIVPLNSFLKVYA